MTYAQVTVSRLAEIEEAISEVLAPEPARPPQGDEPLVACLLFSGVAHDHVVLQRVLAERLRGVPFIGVSSQGLTARGMTIESNRFLGALRIYSRSVVGRVAKVEKVGEHSREKGRALAARLRGDARRASAPFVFYDPLGGVNILEVAEGLRGGGYARVFGAGAGQPFGHMVNTFQYDADGLYRDGAVAMSLEGVDVIADLTHGATPLGLELTVTKTDANVILELDGRPALDVWCERLGVQAIRDNENTVVWALGIVPEQASPHEGLITRAPFGFDEARRALILHAPIPAGARVQVCVRNAEVVLDGAVAMADRLSQALGGRRPFAALSLECGGRAAPLLGEELALRELHAVQARLPNGLPWFGLYAWGELAPLGDRTEFHNYTFPLCLLCEEAGV